MDEAVAARQGELGQATDDLASLKLEYHQKRQIFDNLERELAVYNDELQLAEFGYYSPTFNFATSAEYKAKIAAVKELQKLKIKDGSAIYCNTQWEVSGSKAKGRTMVNRAIKLTARAFNNECEAAIASVKWNNVARMEARIERAYNAINKLNASQNILISNDYYSLKIQELFLAYEYADKKQKEKEEQAELKRQMREEAKLEQEAERAFKEEQAYEKMLEKARQQAEKASGSKLDTLNEKIALLQAELAEAHEKSERAKSMAQQTKSGHVYIISNIGSFGEDVYKIGMTRRLEPLDRVKELGDASVPFTFDIHAMVHSENAPALENALHKKFANSRVNLVNYRKEFFNVTLEEIEAEVLKISPDAEFLKTAEARDYHESVSLRKQQGQAVEEKKQEAFPMAI